MDECEGIAGTGYGVQVRGTGTDAGAGTGTGAGVEGTKRERGGGIEHRTSNIET